MKITFLRKGYANNSSSSHSLIYPKIDLSNESDEAFEFGWQTFTCSSQKHKMNYMFTCLHRSFLNCLYMNFNYDFSNKGGFRKNLNAVLNDCFVIYIEENFPMFKDILEEYSESLQNDNFLSYVDHQSVIFFPVKRNSEIINIDFTTDFIKEICLNRYAILGGNDNDGYNTKISQDDESEKSHIKYVWLMLTDRSCSTYRCEKDELTQEYILSSITSGDLIKVKF